MLVILEIIPALLVGLSGKAKGDSRPVSAVLLQEIKEQGFFLIVPLLLGDFLPHALIATILFPFVFIFFFLLALFEWLIPA